MGIQSDTQQEDVMEGAPPEVDVCQECEVRELCALVKRSQERAWVN
jgi:hypothetical protein